MLCSSVNEFDRVAVDAHDAVAGLDPGPLGGAARHHRLGDRQDVRPADQREDRREYDDGEDEVRRRAGGHDRHALPERREMEEPLPLGERRRGQRLRIGDARGVLVALEAHIAAERDGGELPARAAAVGEAGKLAAEADGEGRDANSAPAGDEEMPHLVHEHDGRQHDQRRDDVAGEIPRNLEQQHPFSVSRWPSGRGRTALQVGPGDAGAPPHRAQAPRRSRQAWPAIPRIRRPSR